jgi:superfamily II DNA or RNA helicase
MNELCVASGSHFFVVTRINPRARPAVEEFARGLTHWDFRRIRGGQFKREPKAVYASVSLKRNEFRFHINCFNKFKETLNKYWINEGMVEWRRFPLDEAPDVCFELNPESPPLYDYQIPAVEYIVKPGFPYSRQVSMQTGRGKSKVFLRSLVEIKKRTLIVIKPSYIEQWVNVIKAEFIIEDSEICVVSGSKQLISLLNLAAMGDLPYKIIIIGNATLRNWFTFYECIQNKILDEGYACTPDKLCEHLKVGYRLIDEVHQDFHFNFKLDLFTNVKRSLSLSATLLSDDQFIKNMMDTAYPVSERYVGEDYIKYVKAYYLKYNFLKPEYIRYMEYGSSTYSHHVFEQSIIKNSRVLANYFDMIFWAIVETYIKNYKPGQKCLIYCASVDMCTRLERYLAGKFLHKTTARYCATEKDSFEDFLAADFGVSTQLSAGTGVDIKGLATVIFTPAVKSTTSNIQGFGRLRNPKDGSIPEFVYFVCGDIVKHFDYHIQKKELLASRALSVMKRIYTTLI